MIKGKIFAPQTGLEMLKVHKISKSQAWQRTGRAGRESAGACYRLFTEAEYESMSLSTVPEIQRSNLLSVALQLTALGIQDLSNFDFISRPPLECVKAALDELELLGAVKIIQRNLDNNSDSNKKSCVVSLTDIGYKMAQFPLDPKLSRCILAAEKLNCVEEVLKIVSVLSVDNVFHATEHLADGTKKEQAHMVRQKFVSADGDHVTLLNVYKTFMANKSNSKV